MNNNLTTSHKNKAIRSITKEIRTNNIQSITNHNGTAEAFSAVIENCYDLNGIIAIYIAVVFDDRVNV